MFALSDYIVIISFDALTYAERNLNTVVQMWNSFFMLGLVQIPEKVMYQN